MKTSGLRICALFASCVTVAACSQSTELSHFQYTPDANSVRDRGAGPPSYRVLHDFGKDHDGRAPNDLINVRDTFYSTTSGGGASGYGTVFSITTGGTEKVLHSFGKGTYGNGSQPYAGLIDVNGTLYGTTEYGGIFGDGTFFSITPDGKERVLHSFGKGKTRYGENDGKNPSSDLIDVRGMLYGTTLNGGSGFNNNGNGTIFSITLDGKEKVLHRFDTTDGCAPSAGLTNVGGTLYGITNECGEYYYGTVFSITPDGKFKLLYNFGDKETDGRYPVAGLTDVRGTLYGTTEYGGANNCISGSAHGCGTIFSIATGGAEKVLHSFGKGNDGSIPSAGLIDVNGTLYGTTASGGANYCSDNYNNGCGTVFSITTGGKEKVLHNFRKEAGGNSPATALTYENGSFFGTTGRGGAFGGGVVFSLTP